MRLSTTLNIYSVRRDGNDPERALTAIGKCKQVGYDAIDFFLKDLQDKPKDYQQRWIARAREAMEKYDIHASQAHSYLLNTRNFDDEAVKAFTKKLKEGIAIASELGVPNLVIHPLCFVKSRGITFEESLKENEELFHSIGDSLAKYHVAAAIENLPGTEYETPEALLELYDRLAMPGLIGFCWDTGHANLSVPVKDRQAECIRLLGDKLTCTHIQDNHGEKDEHILPMMGAIAWPAIVEALRTSGYRGDFTYESAQNLKYLPDDDILRMEMMSYTVNLGRYLLRMVA